jgi:hypothetical protein
MDGLLQIPNLPTEMRVGVRSKHCATDAHVRVERYMMLEKQSSDISRTYATPKCGRQNCHFARVHSRQIIFRMQCVNEWHVLWKRLGRSSGANVSDSRVYGLFAIIA